MRKIQEGLTYIRTYRGGYYDADEYLNEETGEVIFAWENGELQRDHRFQNEMQWIPGATVLEKYILWCESKKKQGA